MPSQGELKREFAKAGCYKIEEGSKHEKWHSPITNEDFQMGRHNKEEVAKGTETALRKKAGVPKKR